MRHEFKKPLLPWTPSRVVDRKRYWCIEGLSASLCAEKLTGTTRNAVISKVHRLGLSGTAHKTMATSRSTSPWFKKRDRKKKLAPQAPRPSPIRALAALPVASNPNDKPTKTFAQIGPGDCRYIPGDPLKGGRIFCGRPQFPGLSYCEFHGRVAYQVPTPKSNKPEISAPAQTKVEA